MNPKSFYPSALLCSTLLLISPLALCNMYQQTNEPAELNPIVSCSTSQEAGGSARFSVGIYGDQASGFFGKVTANGKTIAFDRVRVHRGAFDGQVAFSKLVNRTAATDGGWSITVSKHPSKANRFHAEVNADPNFTSRIGNLPALLECDQFPRVQIDELSMQPIQ